MGKKNAYVDFDGTIHEYKTKFSHECTISDGPYIDSNGVSGIDFIRQLINAGYTVTIFSTRASHSGFGLAAIDWFRKYGLEEQYVFHLKFSNVKGDHDFIFDDRAINMHGTYPHIDSLVEFKPHNKRIKPSTRENVIEVLQSVSDDLWDINDYSNSDRIEDVIKMLKRLAV